MHGPEEPVPAAVSGEHPSGPIGPVGCRSETEHDNPRIGVSKPRDWTSPIFLIAVRGALFDCDELTPFDETGTFATVHDVTFQPVERTHDPRQ